MSETSDYDGAWKNALEAYFCGFLALFWPRLHAQIDWTHAPVFLDKELQRLMRSTKRGRLHVDKLVQLRQTGGSKILVLIHAEIQASHEADFQLRMFRYHVRLHEKHPDHAITSLAVLTYRQKGPTHEVYAYDHMGCSLQFSFPVINLESWRTRMDELLALAPQNPFAVVVLAQLQANSTHPDQSRLLRKTELMRYLYLWKFSRDEILKLFRIIDAMLSLPEVLEEQFAETLAQIEQEHEMTYVSSVERVLLKRERQQERQQGEQQGVVKTLSALLAHKFGPIPDWARVRIAEADEIALQRWALQILDAQRIEDVFT